MTCTVPAAAGLFVALTYTVANPGVRIECEARHLYMAPASPCPIEGPCVERRSAPAPCVADLSRAATLCPAPGEAVAIRVRACNAGGCSAWVGGD